MIELLAVNVRLEEMQAVAMDGSFCTFWHSMIGGDNKNGSY
jgi:hypothetical protein